MLISMALSLARASGRSPHWFRSALARRILTRPLTEELVYWRAERLYHEGLLHPDGGTDSDVAAIHDAGGAETAIRRFADHIGVGELPEDTLIYALALTATSQKLEAEERSALKTLDRLGPSRRIPFGERPGDFVAAEDAEMALDLVDRVHEYLEWMSRVERNGRYSEEESA